MPLSQKLRGGGVPWPQGPPPFLCVRMASIPPVEVSVSDADAAKLLIELLGEDYGAVLVERSNPLVQVEPIDDTRRSVVIYRVIQASRTVQERYPEASLFLLTEEGSRWRLPPPAI